MTSTSLPGKDCVASVVESEKGNSTSADRIAPHFGDIIGGLDSFSPLDNTYEPLERIILLANGNLQRIISAYYNAKVTVVIKKNVRVSEGVYDRIVDLVCYGKVFCTAESKVVVTDEAMLRAVNRYVDATSDRLLTMNSDISSRLIHKFPRFSVLRSNRIGIGQLFRYFGVLPNFRLVKAAKSADDGAISRTYVLYSDGVECKIREVFSKDIFRLSKSVSSTKGHDGEA